MKLFTSLLTTIILFSGSAFAWGAKPLTCWSEGGGIAVRIAPNNKSAELFYASYGSRPQFIQEDDILSIAPVDGKFIYTMANTGTIELALDSTKSFYWGVWKHGGTVEVSDRDDNTQLSVSGCMDRELDWRW